MSSVSAIEGSLISSLRQTYPNLSAFKLGDAFASYGNAVPLPSWLHLDEGRLSPESRQWLQSHLSNAQVTRVITVGLVATQWIVKSRLDLPMTMVVVPDDLNFSERRFPNRRKSLFQSCEAVDALFCMTPFDSFKLQTLGVEKESLIYPLASEDATFLAPISSSDKSISVTVVNPTRSVVENLRRNHTISSQIHELNSLNLYTETDFRLGRGFPGTLKYRLGQSHAVVVNGDFKEAKPLIAALARNHPDRVFVDATISNLQIAREVGLPNEQIGRGQRLVSLIDTASAGVDKERGAHQTVRSNVMCKGQLGSHLSSTTLSREWPAPAWLDQFETYHTFDIFFSVAPIENRMDGARPQRIRNMHDAFTGQGPTLTVVGNQRSLWSAQRSFEHLIALGWRPRVFYGENSTSPMPQDVLERLVDFILVARSYGARTAWFVRDLHLISDDAVFSQLAPEELAKRQRNCLNEFTKLSRCMDLIYSPSANSTEEFRRLLRQNGVDSAKEQWSDLPPALSEFNCPRESELQPSHVVAEREPLQFVYTGGYGSVYSLKSFFTAISKASFPYTLYFCIRPDEVNELKNDLADAGISDTFVTITFETFENVTLPSGSVGVALLDTSYGNNAFPYKVVSYLERNLIVLAYEDSAVADFVDGTGRSLLVKRQVSELRRQLEEFWLNYNSTKLQRATGELAFWEDRAKSIIEDLDKLS